MPFKVAMWDWNGTLVRDVGVAYSAMQKLFTVFAPEAGMPSLEEYKERLDMSDVAAFYYDRGVPKSTNLDEMRSVFEDHYKLHELSLNEGAMHALLHLHGRGVTNALISASSTGDVLDQMRRLHILQLFQKTSLCAYKKDEAIAATLDHFGVKPKQAFYVGDTVEDIDRAKIAGVVTFGVLNGHNSNERVRAARPDYVISDLREIMPLIRRRRGHAAL